MTIKTTGAEFKRFYNDPEFWPEGTWHEDEEVSVDGSGWEHEYTEIPDSAAVTVAYGQMLSDGTTPAPWVGVEGPSVETHFKRWRKKQVTSYGAFECPHDKLEAVKAAIKAAGGRIT